MKATGLLLPLALCGCDGPSLTDKQRDEVGDIAGDVAYDTVTEHEKVKELEARIDELERKLN
jgi:hypothetical protein